MKRNKHTTTVSIYADQLDKFKELGGSAWLRDIIDDTQIVIGHKNLKELKSLIQQLYHSI